MYLHRASAKAGRESTQHCCSARPAVKQVMAAQPTITGVSASPCDETAGVSALSKSIESKMMVVQLCCCAHVHMCVCAHELIIAPQSAYKANRKSNTPGPSCSTPDLLSAPGLTATETPAAPFAPCPSPFHGPAQRYTCSHSCTDLAGPTQMMRDASHRSNTTLFLQPNKLAAMRWLLSTTSRNFKGHEQSGMAAQSHGGVTSVLHAWGLPACNSCQGCFQNTVA